MATALSYPTIPNVTGAPYVPDLTEIANIQTALKYLYYGSTGAAVTANGIYGALSSLQTQIIATQSGVNVHETVKMATTAVLGTTGNLVGGTITTTYANGTADASGGLGIGATLTIATSTNWTAITIDSQSLVVGDRVLIKDQTTTLQNGIYVVTSVGAVGNTTSFVFTRAEDSNNSIAGEMGEGDFVFASNGTTNNNTSWILTSATPTGTGPAGAIKIGTDPVTFIQFGAITWGSQSANTIFAAPTASAGTPTFRTLFASDMSTLNTPSLSGQVLYYAPAGNGMAWTSGTLSLGTSTSITLPNSSSLTLSGGFALTLTQTASTNVTLPTSGTLATIDTAQTFTGTKTFNTVYNIQPTPIAFTATANTMTAAQMLSGIITVTQTAATTVTFPLGGTIEAGWGSLITNASVDLSIINLGTSAGAVTIGANSNSYTGSTSIPIGTSARFRIVRNGTNAYTIYRI
jgi:hypothetical protein